MPLISLASAIALTEKSERTLWRLVAEGAVRRELVQGKALFALESLRDFLMPSLAETEASFKLIEAADQGDAVAQTDLACICSMNSARRESSGTRRFTGWNAPPRRIAPMR